MSCINSRNDYIMCKGMLTGIEKPGNHFNNRPAKQLFPSSHTPDKVQWRGTINGEDLAYASEILARQIYLTSAGYESLSPQGSASRNTSIGYNSRDAVPEWPNGYYSNLVDTLINPLRGLWPSSYILWGTMTENAGEKWFSSALNNPGFRFSVSEFEGILSRGAPNVKMSVLTTRKVDSGFDTGESNGWYITTIDKPVIDGPDIDVATQTELTGEFLAGVNSGSTERINKLLSDTTCAYVYSTNPLAITKHTAYGKWSIFKNPSFRKANKPIDLKDLQALVGARSTFCHGAWIRNAPFSILFAEGERTSYNYSDVTQTADPASVTCDNNVICKIPTTASNPVKTSTKKKFTLSRRVKRDDLITRTFGLGIWDPSRGDLLRSSKSMIDSEKATSSTELGQLNALSAITRAVDGVRMVDDQINNSVLSYNTMCACVKEDNGKRVTEETIQAVRRTNDYEYRYELHPNKLLLCALDSLYVDLTEEEQQCASFTVGLLITAVRQSGGLATFNLSVTNCGGRYGEVHRDYMDVSTKYEQVKFTYDRSYKYLTEVDDKGREWRRPCWVGSFPTSVFDYKADYGKAKVSAADAEEHALSGGAPDCGPEPDGSERFRQRTSSVSNNGTVEVLVTALLPIISNSTMVRT